MYVKQAELMAKLRAEGIELNEEEIKYFSELPRWIETASYTPGVKSAIVKDVLLRSDGSGVTISMGRSMDGGSILDCHTGQSDRHSLRAIIRKIFPELGELDIPANELLANARELIGWDEYVRRLIASP